MKVYFSLTDHTLGAIPEAAGAAEAAGYDGLWLIEGTHDPFFPLLLAAEHTSRLQLSTGLAIALARNPMIAASIAYDLQAYSRGRFRLGLGSQVRAHIERRYSMPWSQPAGRMHEFVRAIRAIWDAWDHGTRLDFQGSFYRHTLMPPALNPGPNPYGRPPILLGGVGERMVETAGEVADGLLCHAFNTSAYLRHAILPALERGLARSGRRRTDFELSSLLLVATGTSEEELAAAKARVRRDLAFYGSTPAYRGVLEQHGWGELHLVLHRLSREGAWDRLADLIDDTILDTIAIVGEPRAIGGLVEQRYGGLFQAVYLYTHGQPNPALWAQVLEGFKPRGTSPSRTASAESSRPPAATEG